MTTSTSGPIGSDGPGAPSAPPTAPGRLVLPSRPTVWPVVVGIICLVIGTVSALAALWNGVSQLIIGQLAMPMGVHPGIPDVKPLMQEMTYPLIASESLKLLLAILLIVLGVLILRRRPLVLPWAISWSIAKLAATVVSIAVTAWAQVQVFDAMVEATANDPNAPVQMQTMMARLKWFSIGGGALISLLLGWGLAIFLLFWMARPRVRAEIANWRTMPGHR